MTKRTQQTVAGMAMVGMLAVGRPATADDTGAASIAPDTTPMSRVRGGDPTITAVMREAAEQSATFRGLVEAINASDGIVYVHAGECGHGVRACLAAVTAAGANRILRVKVDTRKKAPADLMSSIGHELQHAVEVLSVPTVTNNAAMFLFY